jgi:hypothetical protein
MSARLRRGPQALLAEGELERALEAYETALTLAPTSELARVNRDKLPISHAYVSAANTETRMLADRAARVILATAGSRRARGAGHGGAAHATQLYRVCRFLRRLESKQLEGPLAGMLWSTRGGDMPAAISAGATDDGAQYTLSAFAWGGVWLPSLAATFTHPETRAALLGAGATAVVLGASIGFEAYYTSLALGVPTVGVELLCSLTTIADDVRAAHRVHERHMRFECADALTVNLPRSAALVYVDDTAWDEPTIRQLAAKLARTLRKGSVVVHNALAGYADSTAYRLLQSCASPSPPTHRGRVGHTDPQISVPTHRAAHHTNHHTRRRPDLCVRVLGGAQTLWTPHGTRSTPCTRMSSCERRASATPTTLVPTSTPLIGGRRDDPTRWSPPAKEKRAG